jgi:hypothetical protein
MVTRAIRFFVTGAYSTEVEDHKRFKDIPDDFPDKPRYVNQLEILRDDRNSCDYDHAVSESELIMSTQDAMQIIRGYLAAADAFLRQRGLSL